MPTLQILAETTLTPAGEAFAGLSATVIVFLGLIGFVLFVLGILLPYFVYSIHVSQKRQTVLLEQLVRNGTTTNQQLSRLPQVPPPGARR